MKKTILLLVILISLSGCSINYCPETKAEEAFDDFDSIISKWNIAYGEAALSSGYGLLNPIDEMTSIQNDLHDLSVPKCLEEAKEQLDIHMDFVIIAFETYMLDVSDPLIDGYFDRSEIAFDRYGDERLDVIKCLPNCTP